MKIIWISNYGTSRHKGAGQFVHTFQNAMSGLGCEVITATVSLRHPSTVLALVCDKFGMADSNNLVHVWYGGATGYLVARSKCIKVLSLAGSDWYGARHMPNLPFLSRMHMGIGRILTLTSMSRYDVVLVQSKRMLDEVRSVKPNVNVKMVINGCDLNQFKPMPRRIARERLGCARDEAPWVAFCAMNKNSPIKRLDLARAAVSWARRQRGDIRMVELSEIEHEKMSLYLNASDVLLLTSTHEGWPNVVKEALACNVPFVSTDVSDLQSLAAQTRSCKVVDSEEDALGKAILESVSLGRTEDLRQHVLGLDSRSIARHLIDIYAETLAARGRPSWSIYSVR